MKFLDKNHWELAYYKQAINAEQANILIENNLLYIKFRNQIVELKVECIDNNIYHVSKKFDVNEIY